MRRAWALPSEGLDWLVEHSEDAAGLDLLVEHPEHGWSLTNVARLVAAERWVRELPRESAEHSIRYRVERRSCEGVAETAWDAALHAALQVGYAPPDGSSLRVECDEGVELVHAESCGEGFAFWSDGQVTTAHGLAYASFRRGIELAAAQLIAEIHGFRSGPPACGWTILARVAEVREREEIAVGPKRRGGGRDRLERLRVAMVDGEQGDLWIRSGGPERGFVCEVFDAVPERWHVDD